VVFVGVRDDGSSSGLVISDELLRQLADIKTDGNIVPPPTLTVAKRQVAGVDVAVVTVAPADSPPVRFRGRIWIRIGPRRALASAQDERVLNEKRRFRDRLFDVRPLYSAAIEDLDRLRFEGEYLPAAVAPDILEANDRTYEQRLAATKMVVAANDPVPTVLGVLVLGKTPVDFLPGAYVQFLRVAGATVGDPIIDEARIAAPILPLVQQLEAKLVAHNRVSVDFTSGPRERRAPQYPLVALQQIARNAILHRTYEGTNAPVRVYWYDDRIEFLNPGGPYGGVTVLNFGEPGLTDYRNRNLAEAMRVLGLVQRFGAGISTAQRELASNGNPPLAFRVDQSHVLVTVRPAY
jgi:ATP-dependent DNA helicase RecG